jgi:hypothetical protein
MIVVASSMCWMVELCLRLSVAGMELNRAHNLIAVVRSAMWQCRNGDERVARVLGADEIYWKDVHITHHI